MLSAICLPSLRFSAEHITFPPDKGDVRELTCDLSSPSPPDSALPTPMAEGIKGEMEGVFIDIILYNTKIHLTI